MPRQKTIKQKLTSNDLRARSLEEEPTLDVIEKRVDYLIKFFQSVHDSRINLNDWIEFKPDVDIRERTCKIGDSVDNCGTVACVGGFTTINFAPLNLTIGRDGELRAKNGRRISHSVPSIAANLMGRSTIDRLMIELNEELEFEDSNYYDSIAEDWLDELFDGETAQDSESQRQIAINRLRDFKKRLRSFRNDVQRLIIKRREELELKQATIEELEAAL